MTTRPSSELCVAGGSSKGVGGGGGGPLQSPDGHAGVQGGAQWHDALVHGETRRVQPVH